MRDDDTISNSSNAVSMQTLMQTRLTRRDALKAVAAVGAHGLFGCATGSGNTGSGLRFTESARFLDAMHHVAPGYNVQVLLRWGDPLFEDAPGFDPLNQSPTSQSRQFGSNNDFIAVVADSSSWARTRSSACLRENRR